MSGFGRWITALLSVFVLGFGLGEIIGPQEVTAAAGSCTYKACHFQNGDYWCMASAYDADCVWNGEVCTSEVCEDECDPETPDCEGPPEFGGG